MKVNKLFERKYYKGEFTAAQLIEIELDGSDYERGAVEEAQAEAANVKKALGRLVQVLFDNGALKRKDVWHIAGLGYMIDDDPQAELVGHK